MIGLRRGSNNRGRAADVYSGVEHLTVRPDLEFKRAERVANVSSTIAVPRDGLSCRVKEVEPKMESFLPLAAAHSTRTLAPGEVLFAQGERGGDLFVLESGLLTVERDGVKIATIATPSAIIGEMSVLLGKPNSATVRAEHPTSLLMISDARRVLEQDPVLTLRLATLVASRLDVTSALLVDLKNQHRGRSEQTLLGSILASLHMDGGHYPTVDRHDLFPPI